MRKLPTPKFILRWALSLIKVLVWPVAVLLIFLLYLQNISTITGMVLNISAVSQWFLNLLTVIIWPVTVIWIAFAFQEIVAYLFFSMREFSFFGAKGKLKNVQQLINEKVEAKYKKKLDDEKREADQKRNEQELENIKQSKDGLQKKFDETFGVAQKLTIEISQLQEKLTAAEKAVEEAKEKGLDEAFEWFIKNFDYKRKTKPQSPEAHSAS